MKISIGAIPYFWPKNKVEAFYAELVAMPVDCICVGETVCSKRRELAPSDWLGLARELSTCGKEVVLSTLTLIEAGSELAALKRIINNGDITVEANDLSAIQMAREFSLPFITGPTVNIYNGRTLDILVRNGLLRWVPPVELSRESLREILDEFGSLSGRKVETEVFAYGCLPLAHSARCFTARHYDRPKDACGFICIEHPEGVRARTRDDEPFLRLNGIQVQSDAVHCVSDMDDLRKHGADRIRLTPTGEGFFDAVKAFHAWIAGEDAELPKEGLVNGYWTGESGMSMQSVDRSVSSLR